MAKWALHKLCKGQTIRAEVTDVDHYGRAVAKCYLPDGRDLSAEMVKMGLAIDWPKYSGKRYTHLETPDARKRLFLADARQKGRMDMWHQFEARQRRGEGHLLHSPSFNRSCMTQHFTYGTRCCLSLRPA